MTTHLQLRNYTKTLFFVVFLICSLRSFTGHATLAFGSNPSGEDPPSSMDGTFGNTNSGADPCSIVEITESNLTDLNEVNNSDAILAVCPPPIITLNPISITRCGNEAATFTVAASVNGPGTLTFQWRKGIVNITGATNSSYTIPLATNADEGSYNVQVIKSCGTTITSASATLTVNDITAGNISGNQTICSGSDPSILNSVNNAGGDGTISYQWEVSSNNMTWTSIPGATNASYDPGILTATTYYHREAKSALNGVTCNAESNIITITVNNYLTEITLSACDSYTLPWGITATASGNYSHSYSSVNGCDSLVTIHLSINPSYHLTLNPATSCNSYTLPWNQTITTTGTYTHIYSTAAGCDSEVTIHVIIYSGYNITGSPVSSCESYILPWGDDVTSTGNYSHTYSTIYGCDSIVTIHVTINSSYHIAPPTINACDNYSLPWGQSISVTGSYSHVYTSVSGCDSIVTIHVKINSSYTTSAPEVTSCVNYTLPWGQGVTSSGDYTHTYNSQDGCDSIVTTHVTINPGYHLTETPVTSCESYTLPWGETALTSGNYSYTYSSVNDCDSTVTIPVIIKTGYIITNDPVTACNAYVLPWGTQASETSDYTHIFSSVNGCDSNVTIHVTINPGYNTTGSPVNSCSNYILPWGQNVSETGDYGNTYSSINGCDSTVTIHVVIHSPYHTYGDPVSGCSSYTLPWGQTVSATGDYSHSYISKDECDSISTIHVTVNQSYAIIAPAAVACESYSLPWGSIATTTGIYNHSYTSISGCDSLVSISVTIYEGYAVNSNPITACVSYNLPWGQAVSTTGDYSHLYSSVHGCDSLVTTHVTINPGYQVTGTPVTACETYTLPWNHTVNATDDYSHIYSSIHGCDSIVTIHVTIYPGYVHTASPVAGCEHYLLPWGQNVSSSGNYTHIYVSVHGCDSSVTVPVTIHNIYNITGSPVSACSTYTLPWGQTVISGGSYTHTYTSMNGCDSVITIPVTISPVYNIQATPVTACNSYNLPWDEQVSSTGDYTHVYSSVNGCDSNVTVHVTINPVYNLTASPVIACGSYSLPWSLIATSTNSYSHTYTSVKGCDSTVTIHVTIHPLYNITSTPVSACESYTLSWGDVVTTSGEYNHTYSTISGCDSSVTVHVTIHQSYHITADPVTSCQSYMLPWGNVVTSTNDYSHTYSSINGCDSTVTIHVAIYPAYNISTPAITACENFTLPWGQIVNSSGNYTHTYSSIFGCDSVVSTHVDIHSSYHINNAPVTACDMYTLPWGAVATATDNYSHTYTSINGCDSIVSIDVTINQSYATTSAPITACSNYILPWGQFVTSTGDYSHNYFSVNGCDSIVNMHVNINPVYSYTNPSVTACDNYILPWGQSVSASGSFSHPYTSINGCDSLVTIPVIINTSYHITEAPINSCDTYYLPWGETAGLTGDYSHTYTSLTGCDSVVTIHVTVNPVYHITSVPVTDCDHYVLPWGTEVISSNTYTHTYSSTTGCDSIVTIQVTVNPTYHVTGTPVQACNTYILPWGDQATVTGNYTHTYSSVNGCDSIVTIQVTIDPVYHFTSDEIISCGPYLLPWGEEASSTGSYNHIYSTVNGCDSLVTIPVIINPVYQFTGEPVTACNSYLLPWNEGVTASGIYSHIYSSLSGCDSTVSIAVTINSGYDITENTVTACNNYLLAWGQSVTSSGNYSNTYSSITGCDSIVTVPVIIHSAYNDTKTGVITCGSYSLPWDELVTSTGNYSHTYISINGCDSTVTIPVTINPAYHLADTIITCNSYILPWGLSTNTGGDYSYTYFTVNGCDSVVSLHVIINPTYNYTLATDTAIDSLILPWGQIAVSSGNYSHTYSSVNGCDSIITIPVIINVSYDLSGGSATACVSYTLPWGLNVTASGDYKHHYHSMHGTDSLITFHVIINPAYNIVGDPVAACENYMLAWGQNVTSSGDYSHTYYTINGCDSIITIPVIINQAYDTTLASVSACDHITLAWGQEVISSGNYSNTYSTIAGCDSIVSIHVDINPLYSISTPSVVACGNYLLPWEQNVISSGDYSHLYSSVSGCDSLVSTHVTINPTYNIVATPVIACVSYILPWGENWTVSGDYTHIYNTLNGCDSVVTIHLTINPSYEITASPVTACDHYTLPWNQDVQSSGNYSHSYTSISGCDSTITIPVTINPVYNITGFSIASCGNYALPWGDIATLTGSYIHTYHSINGCDSIVTIPVTINQIYNTTTQSVTSCDTYTLPWGESALSTGDYSHTYLSITGCDSIVTTHVTIHPSYDIVGTPITACNSYLLPWGTLVTSSGNYSNTYASSSSGCDSVVTIQVTINPNYQVTLPAVTSCGNYILPWGQTATVSGTYSHTYASVYGCDSIVSINTTINQKYNNSAIPVTACTSYTLPWGLNVTQTGYYSHTYYSITGCDSIVTINVMINPAYSITLSPVAACNNYMLPWEQNITASGNYSHVYSSKNGCDSTVTINVTINPKYNVTNAPVVSCVNYILPWGQNVTSTGNYFHTYSSVKGCDSVVSVQVTINSAFTITGTPVTACVSYSLPWGQIVNMTGNYSHTYSSVKGCDSTVTIPVTINTGYNVTKAPVSACVSYNLPWGQNVVATGNYSHTYLSVKGCDSTVTIPVTINPLPAVIASSNSPICTGSTLNLNSSGGSSYSWTGPNGFYSSLQNPTITNSTTAASGDYTVTAMNSFGCTASATTSVVVNSKPVVTASSNTPLCSGSSLNLSSTGAGTYAWSGPNGFSSSLQNPVISNVTTAAGGTYSVVVTNSSSCSSSATTLVIVNAKPVATASGNSPICSGATLSLSSTGGGTYAWTGPNSFASALQNPTIANVSTAAAGIYTVTVTSVNGCTSTASATIAVNPLPVATASVSTPLCSGNTLSLTSGGGITYSWTGPNGFTSPLQNPVITNAPTAATGTYTVTVTNASACSATATVFATINPKPVATASANSPVCAGTTLNLTSGGGISYSWSGPNGFTSTLQNPSISNVTNAAGGIYTVTVTNASGCTATATVTVSLSSAASSCTANGTSQQYEYIDYVDIGTISRTSGADAGGYYNGTALVTNVSQGNSYTLTTSGGFTGNVFTESWAVFIDWNGDGDFTDANETAASFISSGSGNNTITITVPSTATMGNKRMRVSMHYGCTAAACGSFDYGEVEDYTLNVIPTASSNSPVCTGGSLNLIATGGSTYYWTGPNGFTSTLQSPTISNVTTAASGTYTLAITNSSGCSVSLNTAVVVNVKPTATASGNSPLCVGNNLNLTSTGGTSYSWTGPNGFTSTQQNPVVSNIGISGGGTYTVTALNASGCAATATTSVVVNAKPIATASSNTPLCAGGSINLTSGGGTSYSWTGPNGFVSSLQNPTISNASISASGTYTVTVTNASGCTGTATTTVTVNGATVSSNSPICTGGSLNLGSTGGGTYSWTGPNGFTSTQQNPVISNVSALASGIYTVKLTASCGCTTTATVSVTVNAKPTATISTNSPVCPGSTLNLTSGGGVSYSWTGPNGFTSTLQNPSIANASSSAAGTYTVTVTNASGCSATATSTVTVNAIATASANSPVCAGGTLNLTSTGGGTYSWTGPNGFASTLQNPTITNLSTTASGTYTVTVTNSGCSSSATKSVTVNAKPAPTATSNTPLCVGATLYLTSTGGTTYSWTGPNGFSSTLQNPTITNVSTAAAGTYTVIATNGSGCSASATASLVVNAKPTATASSNSPLSVGSTVNLTSAGGTSYSWTGPNGFTSQVQNPSILNASSAAAGTYTVTVSNASGCTATAATVVTISTCTGFKTYTQGGWGTSASGNNPGTYRNANFCAAFPNGVTIGYGSNWIYLTTSSAVEAFLPSGGSPATITHSYTNPGSSLSNTFAGQIAALSLTLGFDSYDPAFGSNSTLLKNMYIKTGTFTGWTVLQLFNEAQKKLGGGNSSYTVTQLNDACTSINENYDNGTTDNGFLSCSPCKMIGNGPSEREASLNIFPNPNTGAFVADLDLGEAVDGDVTFEIFNMLGQVVFSKATQITDGKLHEEVRFDNSISQGTYVVRITSGNQLFTKQVVYQK